MILLLKRRCKGEKNSARHYNGCIVVLIVACFCLPGQYEAATAEPISALNTTINCDYYSGTESWHYVTLKKWQCVGVVMYPHLNTGYLSMYVVDVNNGTVNQAEYNSDGSFAWIDLCSVRWLLFYKGGRQQQRIRQL
jgi:hypothetical protein